MTRHLFLRAEAASADLEPDAGVYAVVEGELNLHLSIPQMTATTPWITIRGSRTSPMYRGWRFDPLWYELDGPYAGEPRRISPNEYRRIWRDWFFFPSGATYDPHRRVTMPISGQSFTMTSVLSAYLALRKIMIRYPTCFSDLTHAAADWSLPLQPRSVRKLPLELQSELGLAPDGSTDGDIRLMLKDLTQRGPTKQTATLIKPWRRIT